MTYQEALAGTGEQRYGYAAALGTQKATYIGEDGEKHEGVAKAEETGELDHWQEMEKRYEEIYRFQTEANDTAAATATEQSLRAIRAQIDELNESYRQSGRGLYREYREDRKKLPQQLVAAGYTGGLSESSRVKLESDYQENIGESERARLAQIARLQLQGEEARAQNTARATQANAQAGKEYQGYMTALLGEKYAQRQRAAEALGQAGDFSGYAALGYSEAEIERLRLAWEAENPELDMAIKARGGVYSAGEVAALPPVQAQQYLQALGYPVEITGVWDAATESAYRQAFGAASAYGGGGYGYAAALAGEKEPSFKKGRRLWKNCKDTASAYYR